MWRFWASMGYFWPVSRWCWTLRNYIKLEAVEWSAGRPDVGRDAWGRGSRGEGGMEWEMGKEREKGPPCGGRRGRQESVQVLGFR